MYYVYLLHSLTHSGRIYTGKTENPKKRLAIHNAGEVTHTSKYVPWRLETIIGFTDKQKAYAFERYLKSGSGRAFAKKRF